MVVSLLGAMVTAPMVAGESTASEEGHVTLVLQVLKPRAGEGGWGIVLATHHRVDVKVEGAWVSGKTDQDGQVEFSLKPDLYPIRFYATKHLILPNILYDEVMVDITSIPAGCTYQYLYVIPYSSRLPEAAQKQYKR